MRKPVKISLFVVLAILIVGLVWKTFDSIDYGGDFTLNYNNSQWNFKKDAKKLNLVYFGFTKCGDICPMTLSVMGRAFEELTDNERKLVRFIFVSVDHEHDKPVEVYEYATKFSPSFIGVTGDKSQIDKAIKLFPAGYLIEKNPEAHLGYIVTHPDKIFMTDNEGKMIDYLTAPRDSEKVLSEIRKQLNKKMIQKL